MTRNTISILILSWISGCLDALGFLGLGRVFTANMTGNTVILGIAIAQGDVASLLRSFTAITGFSLGILFGTLLVRRNYERNRGLWTAQITRALGVEGCLLLLFALGWSLLLRLVSPGSLIANLLIGLSALAMGQQSAIIFCLGIPGISTTYISGTITTLLANLSRRLSRSIHDEPPVTPEIEHQRPERMATLWITYIVAATVGSYGELHFPALAAYLPLLAMTVVLILRLRAS